MDEAMKAKIPSFVDMMAKFLKMGEWSGYNDGYAFTAPVGSYSANELGLYDMTGNVWERCSDWHSDNYYAKSPRDNPKGPVSGTGRTTRGGAWESGAQHLRTSIRGGEHPNFRILYNLGFRLARTP